MSATFGASLFIPEIAHGCLSLSTVISSRRFDFSEASELFSVCGPCPSLCSHSASPCCLTAGQLSSTSPFQSKSVSAYNVQHLIRPALASDYLGW